MIHLGGFIMAYQAPVIAKWFIHRAHADGEYLTQMKLQKLVYIAHGWRLGVYGKRLITDEVEAWKWGPVIRSLYREYADFGSQPITGLLRSAKPLVSKSAESIMEKVWEVYRRYTASELSLLTRQPDTPWSNAF